MKLLSLVALTGTSISIFLCPTCYLCVHLATDLTYVSTGITRVVGWGSNAVSLFSDSADHHLFF